MMLLNGWLEWSLFGLMTGVGSPASIGDVLMIDVLFVLVIEDFLHLL